MQDHGVKIARQGTSVLLRAYVYDKAQIPPVLYDPDGDVEVNLRNPSGTLVLTAEECERETTGVYQYLYQLASDAPAGAWTADFQTTNGAQVVTEPPFVAFTVVASPA